MIKKARKLINNEKSKKTVYILKISNIHNIPTPFKIPETFHGKFPTKFPETFRPFASLPSSTVPSIGEKIK